MRSVALPLFTAQKTKQETIGGEKRSLLALSKTTQAGVKRAGATSRGGGGGAGVQLFTPGSSSSSTSGFTAAQ